MPNEEIAIEVESAWSSCDSYIVCLSMKHFRSYKELDTHVGLYISFSLTFIWMILLMSSHLNKDKNKTMKKSPKTEPLQIDILIKADWWTIPICIFVSVQIKITRK